VAAMNFAAATSTLPANAAQTAPKVPLFAMQDSSLTPKNRLKNRPAAPTHADPPRI
jgi:hypothetical protein